MWSKWRTRAERRRGLVVLARMLVLGVLVLSVDGCGTGSHTAAQEARAKQEVQALAHAEERRMTHRRPRAEVRKEVAEVEAEDACPVMPTQIAAHRLAIGCGNVGKPHWPLKVPYGTLACEEEGPEISSVTFTTPAGKVYALNGWALEAGDPQINPIWRDNPRPDEGPKMDIGGLIDRGLRLC